MIKQINRILKLVGLNLVRAKRPKAPKSEAQRVKEVIEEFVGPRPPHTREELENCPPNPAWKTQNDGKTHYVGDGCPGGHGVSGCDDHKMTDTEHWETAGGTTPEQNDARFETPRKGATEANQ